MREITRLNTDLDCGWEDEVGHSITSYALGLATAQEQACGALAAVLTEAEKVLATDVSYKSYAENIRACYVK